MAVTPTMPNKPATGTASFAAPTVSLGTAAVEGAAETALRTDATIVAFDATAPSTQTWGDAAAAGAAAVAARRDHKHAMPTDPTITGQVHNVMDYEATGDGSTDDTAAIAAAIAAAFAAGGIVYFPSGTYITDPIKVPPGIRLQGAIGQGYYNATTTVPNANTISRLKLKAGSTDSLIEPDDTGTNLSTHVRISDLALDCNAITQSAINLPDQGSSISRFWRMERLYVVNVGDVSSGYAVYIGNLNTACIMRDCTMFNGTSGSAAGGDAVGWYGQDGIMDNCWIGYWAGNGLTVLGGTSSTYFHMSGGGIFTCTTGVVVAGRGPTFEGVSIDHNYNDGVYVGQDCTFIGCYFHTNSRTTANTWSNIRVAGTQVVNVIGCVASVHGGEVAFDPAYHISTANQGATINAIGNSDTGVTWGTAYTNYAPTDRSPAFPASTTAVRNTIGADVTAYIANGTSAITVVAVNGVTTGLQIAADGWGSVRLAQGATVAFTYAGGTPTWKWIIG